MPNESINEFEECYLKPHTILLSILNLPHYLYAMGRHDHLPIFQKAREILEITKAITDAIDDEDDHFMAKALMVENAYMIGAKIAAAEGGGLYSLRMENAVLIKLAACELKTQTQLLIMGNLSDRSYINLLRDTIDSFKPIFIEWVKNFDPTDDINDGWLYILPPRDSDQ